MTAVNATMVKQLREKTGAGIMDCKEALTACDGDINNAVDFLRKKGLATARRRAGRAMSEGTIQPYIHMGGKLGVLVEVTVDVDEVTVAPQRPSVAFHSFLYSGDELGAHANFLRLSAILAGNRLARGRKVEVPRLGVLHLDGTARCGKLHQSCGQTCYVSNTSHFAYPRLRRISFRNFLPSKCTSLF